LPGYKNPIITLRFPDLVEDDDNCYVVIRNPRLMPADQMRALASKVRRTDADRERIEAAKALVEAGEEIPDELVTEDDADRMFGMIAKLVVGWRVWDPAVPVELDDDGNLIEGDETAPPLLPLPATAKLIAKLPGEILTALMQEMSKINPPKIPADGTGKTS
jgi:hypothetical protein